MWTGGFGSAYHGRGEVRNLDWLPAALSFAGTLCAMVFGYVAILRNRRKDDSENGQQSGIVLTELGYVKSGIDDIKRKQEKQEAQNIEIITRLAKVEASASQAHKRIDGLMGRQ